jgi:hypothetical protein
VTVIRAVVNHRQGLGIDHGDSVGQSDPCVGDRQ